MAILYILFNLQILLADFECGTLLFDKPKYRPIEALQNLNYAQKHYSIAGQVKEVGIKNGRYLYRDLSVGFAPSLKAEILDSAILEGSILSQLGVKLVRLGSKEMVRLPDADLVNHYLKNKGYNLQVRAYDAKNDVPTEIYDRHRASAIILLGTQDVFYLHDLLDHVPGYMHLSRTNIWQDYLHAAALAYEFLDRTTNKERSQAVNNVLLKIGTLHEQSSYNIGRSDKYQEHESIVRELQRYEANLRTLLKELEHFRAL